MDAICQNAASPCGEGCMRSAYAFVPVQVVTRFFDYRSALVSASLFPDLVIPKGSYGPNENFRSR